MRTVNDLEYGSFSNLSPAEINDLLHSEEKNHKLSQNNNREMRIIWLNFLKRDFRVEKPMIPFQEKYDDLLRKEEYGPVPFGEPLPINNPYPLKILINIYRRLYKLKQLHDEQKIDSKFDRTPKIGLALLVCAADQKNTDLSIFKSVDSIEYEDWFELSLYLGCTNISKLFVRTTIFNEYYIEHYTHKLNFYTKQYLDKCAALGHLEMVKFYLNADECIGNLSDHLLRRAKQDLTLTVGGMGLSTLVLALFLLDGIKDLDGNVLKLSTLISSRFLKLLPLWAPLSFGIYSALSSAEYLRIKRHFRPIKPDQRTLSHAISSENKELVEFFLNPNNKFDLSLSKALDLTTIQASNKLIPFLLDCILRNEREMERFFSKNYLDAVMTILKKNHSFHMLINIYNIC